MLVYECPREYACPECGAIYWGYFRDGEREPCPECKNTQVYACDSFGYLYACDGIEEYLAKKSKKVHFVFTGRYEEKERELVKFIVNVE